MKFFLQRLRGGLAAAFLFFAVLAAQAAPALAAEFLWSVKSPGGNQVFLLGSIHLAHEGLYPLKPAIMEAWSRSTRLAVEVDTLALGQKVLADYITKNGLYADGDKLSAHLTPETLALLSQNEFYSPLLESQKPWLAAVSIQFTALMRHGYSTEYGLDKFFMAKARERKLKIISLETMDQQMAPLINLDEKEADLFLRATIEEMDKLPQTMNGLLDAWANGRADELGRIFFAEYDRYPELQPFVDSFIFKRNRQMAARIENLLRRRGDTAFVVLGSAHLVGDRGILAELAAKGYIVEQL